MELLSSDIRYMYTKDYVTNKKENVRLLSAYSAVTLSTFFILQSCQWNDIKNCNHKNVSQTNLHWIIAFGFMTKIHVS